MRRCSTWFRTGSTVTSSFYHSFICRLKAEGRSVDYFLFLYYNMILCFIHISDDKHAYISMHLHNANYYVYVGAAGDLFYFTSCFVLLATQFEASDCAKGNAVNQRPPFFSQRLLWGLPDGNSLI